MTLTARDHAAVTFDHLLTFMAQCDLGASRMDVPYLVELIEGAMGREPDAAYDAMLTAARGYIRAQEAEWAEFTRKSTKGDASGEKPSAEQG